MAFYSQTIHSPFQTYQLPKLSLQSLCLFSAFSSQASSTPNFTSYLLGVTEPVLPSLAQALHLDIAHQFVHNTVLVGFLPLIAYQHLRLLSVPPFSVATELGCAANRTSLPIYSPFLSIPFNHGIYSTRKKSLFFSKTIHNCLGDGAAKRTVRPCSQSNDRPT